MSCPQVRWLHGYFDGELDAARAVEFEAHLPECSACAQALAAQQSLREALSEDDLYAKAPSSLQEQVRTALGASRTATASRPPRGRGLAVAASLVLAFAVLWRMVPAWREDGATRQLTAEVVAAHLRSLQLTHLTDVASTDRHTVKPWFVGKLEFSPEVVDLASDGFPLAGGRLDVLGGRAVAALVYQRRNHVINVFVWTSDASDTAVHSGTQRGYAWIRWTRAGLLFWAVSDIPAPELEEFSRRLSSS